MKILAIETSMGRTSVALSVGGAEGRARMLVKHLLPDVAQAEGLIPLIGALMAEAGLSFHALDRIAVCVGPGGFSGIRTGIAAARGIGMAASVPVTGATSFQIMAASFRKSHGGASPLETFGLAAPAGSNAVYCQIVKGQGEAPIYALSHGEAASFFAGKTPLVAGPAAASLETVGGLRIPIAAPDLMPEAETLCEIAPGLDPERHTPSPYYVRPADAKPQTGYAVERKPE